MAAGPDFVGKGLCEWDFEDSSDMIYLSICKNSSIDLALRFVYLFRIAFKPSTAELQLGMPGGI